MSAFLGRTPAAATAGAPAPLRAGASASWPATVADSLVMRLVAFAALAAFATAHWGMLVEDAPVGRMLLVVLVATGGAAALGMLGRAPLPRPAVLALATLAGLATLALGLMAAGLPGRLLLPAHWSELVDGLDRGLAGVEGVEWPYDGSEPWIRLAVLLGAPAFLAIAATLAFWPARRGTALLRVGGLVALLLFYGTAVAEHDPGRPALRGLALLLLVGAGCGCRACRVARPPSRPRSWRPSARCRFRSPSRSTRTTPGGTTAPGTGLAAARSSDSTGRTRTGRSTGRARARPC